MTGFRIGLDVHHAHANEKNFGAIDFAYPALLGADALKCHYPAYRGISNQSDVYEDSIFLVVKPTRISCAARLCTEVD